MTCLLIVVVLAVQETDAKIITNDDRNRVRWGSRDFYSASLTDSIVESVYDSMQSENNK